MAGITAYLEQAEQSFPHETGTGKLMFLYNMLENGILWTDLAKQPAWYIEDMRYLNTLSTQEALKKDVDDYKEKRDEAFKRLKPNGTR